MCVYMYTGPKQKVKKAEPVKWGPGLWESRCQTLSVSLFTYLDTDDNDNVTLFLFICFQVLFSLTNKKQDK